MESSASAPLDAAELLTALARHDVDCVLIGGTAMQVHGHVRTTQDVDVEELSDEDVDELLVEEVSIDGMCGVY